MSVQGITRRAVARGLDPGQWIRLVSKCLKSNTERDNATKLCRILLQPLLASPIPLFLLLQYLSAGLSSSLFSPSIVIQQLLALTFTTSQQRHYQEEEESLERNVDAVCKIILQTKDIEWTGLSSHLPIESSDGSKLDSINTSEAIVQILQLAIPIRPNCVTLVIRMLDSIPLSSITTITTNTEHAGIDELRSISSDPEWIQKSHPDVKSALDRLLRRSGPRGKSIDQPTLKIQIIHPQEDLNVDIGIVQSPDPLKHDEFNQVIIDGIPSYFCVALKSAMTTSWSTTTTTSTNSSFPEIYKSLILLGPSLTTRSTSFLHYLILASLELMLSMEMVGEEGDDDFLVGKRRRGVGEFVWAVDGVWRVLQWWKGIEDGDWTYPSTLMDSLRIILPLLTDRIMEFDSRMISRHNRLVDDVNVGGNNGMDVDFGFDFNAFGAGDDGIVPVPPPQPFLSLIAQALQRYDLLDQVELQELSLPPPPPTEDLFSLNSILTAEPQQADSMALRALMSPSIYQSLTKEIMQAFDSFASIPDTLIEYLATHIAILDLVVEQQPPARLLEQLNRCLESSINGTEGGSDDPQALLAKCGSLILLIEVICFEYALPFPDSISCASSICLLENLSPAEQQCLAGWIKALFGSSGIDDEILQATTPFTLAKLAPTLVSQACLAAQDDIISLDILRGGLSYFSQPLLSWCVSGVLEWLCVEIPRQGPQATFHLDVLSVLLMGGGLPTSVLHVHADSIEEILHGKNGLDRTLEEANVDVAALLAKLEEGKRSRKRITVRASPTAGWPEAVQIAIRELLQSENYSASAFAAVDTLASAITRTSLPITTDAVLHELIGMESSATIKLTTALQLLWGPSMARSVGYSIILRIPHLLQTSQLPDDKSIISLAHITSVILKSVGKAREEPAVTASTPANVLALELYINTRTQLEIVSTKRRNSTLRAFAHGLAKDRELVEKCPFFARLA